MMKYWGCIFFVVGVFLTTFTAESALAGGDIEALIDLLVEKGDITKAEAKQLLSDPDALINLLVKKEIITPEEAAQLSSEMEKTEQTQQAEIENIVKEVTEKEMKTFEGLKNVSLAGLYFLEWSYSDPDKSASFNEFTINRAYFTLKYKFNDWFSSRFTTDITYKADKTEGWELRLKYAYGIFDTKSVWGMDLRLRSEVGLVHTASDNYDSFTWPYRCQAKNYLDRHDIQTAADYGLNVNLTFGELDKEWQQRVTDNLASKWGGIWIGVYNGPGYDEEEINAAKNWEVLAYLRPFNMIEVLKGFRLGYQRIMGESNSEITLDLEDYPDYKVDQFMAAYEHEYFTLMAQFYQGESTTTADDHHERDGYNTAAFMTMPFHKNLRIFGRYDIYDKDVDAQDTDEKIATFGSSYDIIEKNLMFWAAIEDTDFEKDAGEEDHTDYLVGLQIKFP